MAPSCACAGHACQCHPYGVWHFGTLEQRAKVPSVPLAGGTLARLAFSISCERADA